MAEEKRVFFWAGRVGAGGLAAFTLPAFFFLRTATVVRCMNLVTGAGAVCAVSRELLLRKLDDCTLWWL